MYTAITGFFGLVADLFFKRRHLGGAIPREGATLVVGNHPNGIVDPIMVTRVAGRPVRFLAKEPLFRMPVIGFLLKRIRALPIYRAQDGHDTKANLDTFSAVYAALEAGEAVCLFPEGVSHDEPELQPLKTGAARMALGTAPDTVIRVVPVGMTYRDKSRFRGEVATQIGAPVEVAPFRARYAEAPKAGVAALTAAIDEAIREVTVNLATWEDLPLLELAERIWPGENDPVERLRNFSAAQQTFEREAPEVVERLRARLLDFDRSLRALGMTDPGALDYRYHVTGVGRFVLRNTLALLVGMPAALLGAVVYFVPYNLVRVTAALMKPKIDLVASVKLLAAILYFLVWQAGLTAGLLWWLGPAAGLGAAVVLPLCGLYTHRFVEGRALALRELSLFVRLPSDAALRRALCEERDGIAAEIEALAAKLPA